LVDVYGIVDFRCLNFIFIMSYFPFSLRIFIQKVCKHNFSYNLDGTYSIFHAI